MKEKYIEAIKLIINEQEEIVGTVVAVSQSQKIDGMTVHDPDTIELFSDDPKKVLGELVNQFFQLFGPVSVAVCKEVLNKMKEPFTPEELPDILK